MQTSRKALLLGATGLTGEAILQQLLVHPSYESVHVFVRRPMEFQHPKLQVHVIDFDNLEQYAALFQGDDLYACLGTTMAKAGSKDAFYKVDFTYPYEIGRMAKAAGLEQYVLVSSVGADSNSKIFYSRVKGKLEEAICGLGFSRVQIMQPGVLVGARQETRMAEAAAIWLTRFIDKISSGRLLGKYRPSPVEVVASAMIQAALYAPDGHFSYASDELYTLSEQHYTWTKTS